MNKEIYVVVQTSSDWGRTYILHKYFFTKIGAYSWRAKQKKPTNFVVERVSKGEI